MRSRNSRILPTAGLLVALTAFSLSGCASSPATAQVESVHPPLPMPAELHPVKWQDKPELGGLLLPYDEYRKLEANIIEYRREIEELRDLARFYGSED
jgi:hypothetical protein